MSGTESAATGSSRAEASHRAGEEGNPSFFVSTSVNHRDWVQAAGSTIFFLSKPSNLRKNFLVAATALGQRKSANPVLWRLRVAGVQRRERTNWEQVSGRGSPVLYCAPAHTPMISRA